MGFGEEWFGRRKMGGCVQVWLYPVPRLSPDTSSPLLFLIRKGKVQMAKELWNREVQGSHAEQQLVIPDLHSALSTPCCEAAQA